MEGAAIGSPLSPIVANIFKEKFEKEALDTAPHPQVCGKDMLMILLSFKKSSTKKSFFSI